MAASWKIDMSYEQEHNHFRHIMSTAHARRLAEYINSMDIATVDEIHPLDSRFPIPNNVWRSLRLTYDRCQTIISNVLTNLATFSRINVCGRCILDTFSWTNGCGRCS
jgi:hypothetical protein